MGKNTTNDMTQETVCVCRYSFSCRSWQEICFSSYTALQTLWWWEKELAIQHLRRWKHRFRTFSDHRFRNWADRRIGNLYFSVFWKWQL